MFCKNCGANINDGEIFCPECGTKQDVVQQEVAQPEVQQYNPQPEADVVAPEGVAAVKAGGDKKKFTIIGIAAVVVVAILALIFAFAGKGGSDELDFALFTKDGNLYINYLKDNSTQKLSSKGSYTSEKYCAENGYLYFLDDYDNGSYTLRYTDTTVKKAEDRTVEKIVSGVLTYTVSNDGKMIYYKTDEGVLYAHNYEEKTKIGDDVSSYYCDEKNNVVAYLEIDEDDDDETVYKLYSVNKKYEKTEVLKDVEDWERVNNFDEPYKLILFANDKVYLFEGGKLTTLRESFSIDDDEVFTFVAMDDKNNFYYTLGEEGDATDAADYLTDSKKSSDENVVMPDEDDTKYWEEWYESYWYSYATKYTDEYYADLKAYKEKVARDDIRDCLEEGVEISGISKTNLIYFNGKEDVTLVENISGASKLADNVIKYTKSDLAVDVSIDIDDIVKKVVKDDEAEDGTFGEDNTSFYVSSWDIIEYVKEQLVSGYTKGVLVDNTPCTIKSIVIADTDDEDMAVFNSISADINADNTAIYYIEETDEETGTGTLYKMDIKSKALGEAKEVYKDVYSYWFDDDNNIYTTKEPDIDDYGYVKSVSLYKNDKLISDDVKYEEYMSYNLLDSGEFMYETDYSSKHYTAKLNMYDGKNPVTIADDVYDYCVMSAEKIFFISDYDDGEGDLNLWTGAKKDLIKVDDGVSSVFLPSVIEKK